MNVTDDDVKAAEIIDKLIYWIDGPIYFTLSHFGLAANFITIILLSRRNFQRLFHKLLLFLSLWDFLFLLIGIFCFSLHKMNEDYKEKVFYFLIPYLLPTAQICYSASTYSTMALTVERYLNICSPFFNLRHNVKARYFCLPIIIFAGLYNLPRFFEFSITYTCPESGQTLSHHSDEMETNCFDGLRNMTEICEEFYLNYVYNNNNSSENDPVKGCWDERVRLELTPFRNSTTYKMYYMNVSNILVNLVCPVITLTALTVLIHGRLKTCRIIPNDNRPNDMNEPLTIRRNVSNSHQLQSREIQLAHINIIIVCVFIVCHVPRFIPNVIELYYGDIPQELNLMLSLNKILQIINCSVNLFIYNRHKIACRKYRGPCQSMEMGDVVIV